MNPIPFIDIHTHSSRRENDTVAVQNIFPGEGFAAFSGQNFYSVGLHPWHIQTRKENKVLLGMVEDALRFDHVILVGETGLDKLSSTDFEEQKRIFEAHALIAEENHCPLIIHCVKAYNEVLEFAKYIRPQMQWILHSYGGSLETTKQLAKHGFLFSFGENLLQGREKAVESYKYLPQERIFFETDEMDGEVKRIYEKGAELKGIDVDFLKKEVWDNFNRLESRLIKRF